MNPSLRAFDERRPAAVASAEVAGLRLGVLVDAQSGERWIAQTVRAALAIPGTELAAVAVLRRRPARASAAGWLHAWLDVVDRGVRCRAERHVARIDLLAALAPSQRIDLTVATHAGSWALDAREVEMLRRCAVDYWLCCTALRPRRPLLAIASRGVLGLEIGDVPAASRWAGAPEVGTGNPVTHTSIVDYAESDAVLCRGAGTTFASSSARNRAEALRRGAHGFVRVLAQAAEAGGRCLPRPELAAVSPPASPPTLGGVARLGRQIVRRATGNRLQSLRWREQWQIAYEFADEGATLDVDELRYLVPPPDRYWADPFALCHANRHYVLFEEARYADERGRIVAIEVHEHGEPGVPQVVLERPYHLSYPFLFRHDGALYMLPETAANNRLEVYRCEAPLSQWRLHAVLLENVRAFDATLWQENERWWLFASVGAPGSDGNDELHLYSSTDGPFGPWRPHRRNPVVADARHARCAGPLFRRAGALYRPSQDCTPVYGRSVVVNRVDVLDDYDYREQPVGGLDPGWRSDVLRVHTLGGSGRLRVIDCSVRRRRW